MKAVDFRNLIGRVGRLEYNLYGNVFLVAANEKAEEKYEELLKEDIKPQALSVEKGLTKPQARYSELLEHADFLLDDNKYKLYKEYNTIKWKKARKVIMKWLPQFSAIDQE